jgi:hypothetical protein
MSYCCGIGMKANLFFGLLNNAAHIQKMNARVILLVILHQVICNIGCLIKNASFHGLLSALIWCHGSYPRLLLRASFESAWKWCHSSFYSLML